LESTLKSTAGLLDLSQLQWSPKDYRLQVSCGAIYAVIVVLSHT